MYYGGSISPPRAPPLKKHVISRRGSTETKMAGDGEKTPPGSLKKPLGGKGVDGAGSSGKGEVLRVVREIGGSANWPMPTKTNYMQWSLLMKLKMKARHL